MPQPLTTRDHPFSGVNPPQAREFARATGTLDKTDRVDARVLAQMNAALDLPATIPISPARSHLADFLRRRRQLVDMRDRMRAKSKTPKTIHIAAARKLLVILNAMIRKRQSIALG